MKIAEGQIITKAVYRPELSRRSSSQRSLKPGKIYPVLKCSHMGRFGWLKIKNERGGIVHYSADCFEEAKE